MEELNKKLVLFLIFSIAISVFSCDQQPEIITPEQPPTLPEQEAENPVSEYGESMISAYTQGKMAGEMGNLDAVRKTINAFHATHDRYPYNLEEIKPMFGSPIDLSIYDYEPDTGKVALKK